MNKLTANIAESDSSVATASSHSTALTNKVEGGKRRVGAKSYKIQIQLSEKAKERLFELVERTEAESAAQVVRDALRIYDILFDEVVDNDNDLLLRSKDSEETARLRLF